MSYSRKSGPVTQLPATVFDFPKMWRPEPVTHFEKLLARQADIIEELLFVALRILALIPRDQRLTFFLGDVVVPDLLSGSIIVRPTPNLIQRVK